MSQINVERYGRGTKVIFIHGSGWNTRLWIKQKEYLHNFMEVILIDLPGHGRSPGKGCDSVDEYRKVVEEVIEEYHLQKSFVVGHSLGGAITMALALHKIDLLTGLIIVGSGARLKVLPQILDGIRNKKEETINYIASLAFSPKAETTLVKENFFEMMKCPADVIYKDFFSCNNFDIMDEVKKVELPTLIICGLDDRLTPPKYAQYLHNEIKDSKLVLIEGAGHMVMLERPDEVNKAIMEFIDEVNRKS